jgi:hypothetical protein
MEHKLVDGIQIPLSAEEIAQRQADELAWQNGAFDRAISSLRARRNALLSASDWTVLSDSPVQDKLIWQSYRQSLRDLTEGLSTVEQVNSVVFPTKP